MDPEQQGELPPQLLQSVGTSLNVLKWQNGEEWGLEKDSLCILLVEILNGIMMLQSVSQFYSNSVTGLPTELATTPILGLVQRIIFHILNPLEFATRLAEGLDAL